MLACAEVLGDERAATAVGFLARALAFFSRHGITTERVITDNGSAHRSAVHVIACRALAVPHNHRRKHSALGHQSPIISPVVPSGDGRAAQSLRAARVPNGAQEPEGPQSGALSQRCERVTGWLPVPSARITNTSALPSTPSVAWTIQSPSGE